MKEMSVDYKKILIKGVNWVGDGIFITPALAALRSGLPNAEINLLVPEDLAGLYQGNPNIDELITYQHKGSLKKKLELSRILKTKRFDLGIIMQSSSYEAAFLLFMAGIPVRIGYSHSLRNFLLTRTVKRPEKITHEVDFFLGLIKTLGVEVKKKEVFMAGNKEASSWADEFLARHGYKKNESLVGIFPGAHFGPAKRWLPERYAELIDRLKKTYDARVIIFGGENDLSLAEKIVNDMTTIPINAVGKTSLQQLKTLIEKCHLFITNDSGPLQIASTTTTPIIALFGSTDHKKTGPWRKQDCTIIYKKVSCSPCFKRACRSLICFKEITVADILREAKTYLKPTD